jgi:hypothetical protein
MKSTFIYCLVDPRDNQVRYIGKSNNPKQRLKNHCNPARYRPTYKFNWINLLRKLNLKPELFIVDEVDIDEWKFWEQYWIEQFTSWGFNLVNYCKGGEGLSFGNQTSFKKGSKPWNKNIIKKRNCIVCKKIFIPVCNTSNQKSCSYKCAASIRKSDTQYSKNHTPWNKGLKGKKLKPDKNVYQFNKEKTIMIKKWNTAKEAGEALSINIAGIGQCARGNSKSCGGYYWSYKNILL